MTAAPLSIVHNRVDALHVAFRVTIDELGRVALRRAADVADVHGRSAVHVAGLDWELRASAAKTVYLLRREEHASCKIDLNAPGGQITTRENTLGEVVADEQPGWTISIEIRASHLAEVGFSEALAESKRLARAFGKVHESRLRRIDLAADVAGWRIRDRDRRALVRRSRVRTSDFARRAPERLERRSRDRESDRPSPERGYVRMADQSVRENAKAVSSGDAPRVWDRDAVGHSTPRRTTGLTIGRGDVVARIYNKREELRCCSPHKQGAEETRWTSGGWDGRSDVTRVEFQLRGEAIREIGARSIDSLTDPRTGETIENAVHDPETGEVLELASYLPRIWSTCLRWVRLVERHRTRSGRWAPLTRCSEDQRWSLLHRASWGGADRTPIRRRRERGGASSSQALGSLLSVAAARGLLASTLPEEPAAWKASSADQLRSMLQQVAAFGVDLIAVDMLERWNGPEHACVHLAVLWNAARARFARIHEKEKVPWLQKSNPESTRPEPSRLRLSTD